MSVSWGPVVLVDILGSVITLLIAVYCAVLAWRWTARKREDVFRNYIFLLTMAIVFFAVSRSFGHLMKQILLLQGMAEVWRQISPFSGAINSAAFIVIFAFGIYFHRFQKVHLEIERHRNHLETLVEERTAELAETNIKLENVLNSSIPICITSVDFDLVQANSAYHSIWPVGSHDRGREKCFESRPGPYCNTDSCPLRQIIGGREEVVLESSKDDNRGTDGKRVFIITARPFRDARGNLIGIVESFQNITARKNAEMTLAAERERLAVTLRSIGDGVIVTDMNGAVTLMNKAAEDLTGWSQKEAAGERLDAVLNIIDESTREQCENPVEGVIRTGLVTNLGRNTVLIRKDGSEIVIEDSAAPIRDRESRIIGVVLVFRDVTSQHQMEQELQKMEKLESLGILAGGLAHDFNNLLTAIIGNVSLAKMKIGVDHKSFSRLNEAEKAAQRATDLTHQLLTFARGGSPIKQFASIPEIAKDAVNFALSGSKVKCIYTIPPALWTTEVDRGQMTQVFHNLIINSIQAMPEGGTVHVHFENVTLEEEESPPLKKGNYVKITFRDEGEGIAGSHINKIFEPYFTTRQTGSGLGLATVFSILQRHGGYIYAESQVGEGTSFYIFIPAVRDTVIPATEEKEGIRHGQGRILIMDDEELVRNVSGEILTSLGYEVGFAEDGKEAIDAYMRAMTEGKPFDVVVMDLTIPGGMGGREAVRKLLEVAPDAKVIVSSGYSMDPVMSDYREYGFCEVITKPYSANQFSAILSKVMKGPRQKNP